MENWYLPITIVPGLGLLVLSTSNLLGQLSLEIRNLLTENSDYEILLKRKMSQLKLLNLAMVFLYLSIAFFVISGLVGGLYQTQTSETLDYNIPVCLLLVGMFFCLIAISILMVFSFKAVRIKQDQFKV